MTFFGPHTVFLFANRSPAQLAPQLGAVFPTPVVDGSHDPGRLKVPGGPVAFLRHGCTRVDFVEGEFFDFDSRFIFDTGRWGIRPDTVEPGVLSALTSAGVAPAQVEGQGPLLTEIRREALEPVGYARRWLLLRPCVLVLSGYSLMRSPAAQAPVTVPSPGPQDPLFVAGLFVAGAPADPQNAVALITRDEETADGIVPRPVTLPPSLVRVWLRGEDPTPWYEPRCKTYTQLACLGAHDPRPHENPNWGVPGTCAWPELDRMLQGCAAL